VSRKETPQLPLDGLRVVDLTNNVAGPFATLILADLGATVLKVERPVIGDDSRHFAPSVDGRSAGFEALNRGKGSISLDLKSKDGKNILKRLMSTADVLVESMRPGKLADLGFGPGDVAEFNEDLIYCSVSGFGHTGPMRTTPGYDILIQSLTGIMDITGAENGPPVRVGPSIIDIGTGIWAGLTIMVALRNRDLNSETGIQHLDVSLFDVGVSWMTLPLAQFQMTGIAPQRLGGRTPLAAPGDIYATSDGYVTVGILNDRIWEVFVELVQPDPDLDLTLLTTNKDRVEHVEELTAAMTAVFRTRTTQEWLELLEPHGVTIQPVRTVAELVNDAQAIARGLLRPVQHPALGDQLQVALPFANSGFSSKDSSPAPDLGQDTLRTMIELGYSKEEINRLCEVGVIEVTEGARPGSGQEGDPSE